jgi:hypothetical protein
MRTSLPPPVGSSFRTASGVRSQMHPFGRHIGTDILIPTRCHGRDHQQRKRARAACPSLSGAGAANALPWTPGTSFPGNQSPLLAISPKLSLSWRPLGYQPCGCAVVLLCPGPNRVYATRLGPGHLFLRRSATEKTRTLREATIGQLDFHLEIR